MLFSTWCFFLRTNALWVVRRCINNCDNFPCRQVHIECFTDVMQGRSGHASFFDNTTKLFRSNVLHLNKWWNIDEVTMHVGGSALITFCGCSGLGMEDRWTKDWLWRHSSGGGSSHLRDHVFYFCSIYWSSVRELLMDVMDIFTATHYQDSPATRMRYSYRKTCEGICKKFLICVWKRIFSFYPGA